MKRKRRAQSNPKLKLSKNASKRGRKPAKKEGSESPLRSSSDDREVTPDPTGCDIESTLEPVPSRRNTPVKNGGEGCATTDPSWKSFACRKCDFRATTHKALMGHRETVHEEEVGHSSPKGEHYCRVCDFCAKSRYEFEHHMESPKHRKLIKCSKVPKKPTEAKKRTAPKQNETVEKIPQTDATKDKTFQKRELPKRTASRPNYVQDLLFEDEDGENNATDTKTSKRKSVSKKNKHSPGKKQKLERSPSTETSTTEGSKVSVKLGVSPGKKSKTSTPTKRYERPDLHNRLKKFFSNISETESEDSTWLNSPCSSSNATVVHDKEQHEGSKSSPQVYIDRDEDNAPDKLANVAADGKVQLRLPIGTLHFLPPVESPVKKEHGADVANQHPIKQEPKDGDAKLRTNIKTECPDHGPGNHMDESMGSVQSDGDIQPEPLFKSLGKTEPPSPRRREMGTPSSSSVTNNQSRITESADGTNSHSSLPMKKHSSNEPSEHSDLRSSSSSSAPVSRPEKQVSTNSSMHQYAPSVSGWDSDYVGTRSITSENSVISSRNQVSQITDVQMDSGYTTNMKDWWWNTPASADRPSEPSGSGVIGDVPGTSSGIPSVSEMDPRNTSVNIKKRAHSSSTNQSTSNSSQKRSERKSSADRLQYIELTDVASSKTDSASHQKHPNSRQRSQARTTSKSAEDSQRFVKGNQENANNLMNYDSNVGSFAYSQQVIGRKCSQFSSGQSNTYNGRDRAIPKRAPQPLESDVEMTSENSNSSSPHVTPNDYAHSAEIGSKSQPINVDKLVQKVKQNEQKLLGPDTDAASSRTASWAPAKHSSSTTSAKTISKTSSHCRTDQTVIPPSSLQSRSLPPQKIKSGRLSAPCLVPDSHPARRGLSKPLPDVILVSSPSRQVEPQSEEEPQSEVEPASDNVIDLCEEEFPVLNDKKRTRAQATSQPSPAVNLDRRKGRHGQSPGAQWEATYPVFGNNLDSVSQEEQMISRQKQPKNRDSSQALHTSPQFMSSASGTGQPMSRRKHSLPQLSPAAPQMGQPMSRQARSLSQTVPHQPIPRQMPPHLETMPPASGQVNTPQYPVVSRWPRNKPQIPGTVLSKTSSSVTQAVPSSSSSSSQAAPSTSQITASTSQLEQSAPQSVRSKPEAVASTMQTINSSSESTQSALTFDNRPINIVIVNADEETFRSSQAAMQNQIPAPDPEASTLSTPSTSFPEDALSMAPLSLDQVDSRDLADELMGRRFIYMCVCGMGFRNESLFHIHEKCHMPWQPLTCAMCETMFSDKETFNRHLANH